MLEAIPISFIHRIQARVLCVRLKEFLPTNMNISVSDPVSAMVCATLNFLSTPAGQQICADVRAAGKTIITDILDHVHGQVTAQSKAA